MRKLWFALSALAYLAASTEAAPQERENRFLTNNANQSVGSRWGENDPVIARSLFKLDPVDPATRRLPEADPQRPRFGLRYDNIWQIQDVDGRLYYFEAMGEWRAARLFVHLKESEGELLRQKSGMIIRDPLDLLDSQPPMRPAPTAAPPQDGDRQNATLW